MFGLAPLIYVQITPQRLVLHHPKKRKTRIEAAELALAVGGRSRTVLAVGNQARAAVSGHSHVLLVRPFDHPRSLVSDFVAGQHLLRELLTQFVSRAFLMPAPHLVLHPQGPDAGGYTAIEVRAFREMAMASGAASVRIWHGNSLSTEQLLAGDFSRGGTLLRE